MKEKGINHTTNEDVIHHPKVQELYRNWLKGLINLIMWNRSKFELLPESGH